MHEVTMKKEELAGILQKNRNAHQDLFEEAHQAFREKAIANLESRLDAVKKGQPVKLHLELVEPEDHTADYNRALKMLDYEVSDTVILQQHEFSQLVEDDWGWKDQFATSYSMNTGKAMTGQRIA